MKYDQRDLFFVISVIADTCTNPLSVLRVYSYLQAVAEAGVATQLNRAEIAEMAGVSLGTASRAITELEDIGALDRIDADPTGRRGRAPVMIRIVEKWWLDDRFDDRFDIK